VEGLELERVEGLALERVQGLELERVQGLALELEQVQGLAQAPVLGQVPPLINDLKIFKSKRAPSTCH